jgi:tetratricopeptide (TPR) repeat protein
MKKRTKYSAFTLVLCCLTFLFAGCNGRPTGEMLKRAEQAAMAEQWKHAEVFAEKAAEYAEARSQALVLLALAKYHEDNMLEGIETAEDAAEKFPNMFAAQYFYGWLLCQNEQWADALPPLRRAHELNPSDVNTLVLLAKCCIKQNLIQGVNYLQALARRNGFKDSATVYNGIAMLWLGRPNYIAAQRFFLKAHALDPENVVVLQNLAVLHDVYLNDEANALKYYRMCLRQSQLVRDEERVKAVVERLRQLSRRRSGAG